MDIYCANCGEPWDALEPDRKEIVRGNCEACRGNPKKRDNSLRTQAVAALAEIAGDDIDGLAADLEDFEYMGLLND